MNILVCGGFLLCLTLASAGDLSHVSQTTNYASSDQLSGGYDASSAYPQQTLNLGNYASGSGAYDQSGTVNSYQSNSAEQYGNDYGYQQNGYGYAQNGNAAQSGYAQNDYQIQDISSNHIDGSAHFQSQFDASTVDLTNSGQSNGGFQGSYGDVQNGGYYASGGGHAVGGEQVIHTQAEAIPISKHVEITKNVPYPVYKQVHVPVQRPVNVHIPHPVLVPVPHAYPIHIPVSKPVAVPIVKEITIPIEKVVPYPVIKKVPYPVEKHVPYHVEKFITVHKKVPYAVKVPVVKTIIHRVNSDSHHGYGGHGDYGGYGGGYSSGGGGHILHHHHGWH